MIDTSENERVKVVTWDEVRDDVKHINPELHQIIEDLSPSKKLRLVKLAYAFGDTIVRAGSFQLPPLTVNQTINLSSVGLDYNTIPLSILLDKSCEIFIDDNAHIVPLKIFSKGMLFGTFETIDYLFRAIKKPLWHITAGSRSVFTLPSISDRIQLNKIRNYFNLLVDIHVLSMRDHWFLFKQIAQNKNFMQPWMLHLIAFSKDWFLHGKTDRAWFAFQSYLFKKAWLQVQQTFMRDELAIFWQTIIKSITQRKMRPTPYVIDTLRHLLLIVKEQAPFLEPLTDDEQAPVSGLQDVLCDVYLLKHHMPMLMGMGMLLKNNYPGYYSLSLPTLIDGSPATKQDTSNIMRDLKIIQRLIEILSLDEQTANVMLKDIQFGYYHVETDKEQKIMSSKQIIQKDARFISPCSNYSFCDTSAFWRGCFMISNTSH